MDKRDGPSEEDSGIENKRCNITYFASLDSSIEYEPDELECNRDLMEPLESFILPVRPTCHQGGYFLYFLLSNTLLFLDRFVHG